MAHRYTHAPSLEEIEAIAVEAFGAIPEPFREFARDAVIHVTDFPDRETEAEMQLQSPFDLLGLYRGIPIGERGSGLTAQDVDRIFLYRRPILDVWCEGEDDLAHLVRHVLIHEIGHHFGLTEEDLAELGYA